MAREWPPVNRDEMLPSDDDEDSDDDASDHDVEEEGFDFVDPLEEVRKQRELQACPEFGMSEAEALVHAIVTSEAELAERRRLEQDTMLAQQLELDEVRKATREVADLRRTQFRRRWQCAYFLYDVVQLRAFCRKYDMPFATIVTAPVPWQDRVRNFQTTRLHDFTKEPEPYRKQQSLGSATGRYVGFAMEYRRKTGVAWSIMDFQCDLLCAQYLLAHVYLYFVQDRSNPARVRGVVEYLYGGNVSGDKKLMLAEAREWMAVLVQLVLMHDVFYAFDRETIAMILRHVLDAKPPNQSEMVADLHRIRPLIRPPKDAFGSANNAFCVPESASAPGSPSASASASGSSPPR